MNAKELRRGEVLSRVKRGELKLTEAAALREVSYRQAKRLKKRYGEGGSQALVHGSVGRTSNRADPQRRERALELVRENYSGEPRKRFGPTLAAEHLQRDHDLEISVRTLRRWMLAAGLWSRRRKRKPHRSRRQRKAHFGELIQLDGSHHDWLEGIADYEAANRYLDQQYLDEHNAKFVCEPSAGAYFHQRLPKGLALQWVFCLEAERVVSNDLVVRFENRFLQLKPRRNQDVGAGAQVTVQQARVGELRVVCEGGDKVAFEPIARPRPKPRPEPKLRATPRRQTPAADYPWRQPLAAKKRVATT